MNISVYFSRILQLTLVTLLIACGDDDQVSSRAPLVGTWKLTETQTEFSEGTDVRAFYQQYFADLGVPASSIAAAVDTIMASLDEPITSDDIGDITWTLRADGAFIESDGTTQNTGTWSLGDNDVLTITNGSDDMIVIVASVTNTSLEVHQDINSFLGDDPFSSLGPDFPPGTLIRMNLIKQL